MKQTESIGAFFLFFMTGFQADTRRAEKKVVQELDVRDCGPPLPIIAPPLPL